MAQFEKGAPPVVLYPGECYYCGSCVMACPVKGAIHLRHPLMNQTKFVRRRAGRGAGGEIENARAEPVCKQMTAPPASVFVLPF